MRKQDVADRIAAKKAQVAALMTRSQQAKAQAETVAANMGQASGAAEAAGAFLDLADGVNNSPTEEDDTAFLALAEGKADEFLQRGLALSPEPVA